MIIPSVPIGQTCLDRTSPVPTGHVRTCSIQTYLDKTCPDIQVKTDMLKQRFIIATFVYFLSNNDKKLLIHNKKENFKILKLKMII